MISPDKEHSERLFKNESLNFDMPYIMDSDFIERNDGYENCNVDDHTYYNIDYNNGHEENNDSNIGRSSKDVISINSNVITDRM
nr:11733_t:CDS:2 [Entrophospora candida]